MQVDAELTARMDASLAAYWCVYGHSKGARTERLPGAVLSFTGIPMPLFNTVILTAADPAIVDSALARAAEFIATEGQPVLWRVSPNAASPDVLATLEQAGLRLEFREPALIAALASMPSPEPVEGLTIETATTPAGRAEWAALACDGFGLADDVRAAMSVAESTIPDGEYETQFRYTGYLGGKPVAVSSLVMAGGLAGIYAVATLPEARKRGIGAAMTLHATSEGKAKGADITVLQATDMGRPIYERIGFRVAFPYLAYVQS